MVNSVDLLAPPKFIFDPSGDDDDGVFEDDMTEGESPKSRGKPKHPSQLNEVELRVQLWDAYRLARIIMGTPIRSVSLKGKTILQSIAKVAEMKMELVRLQNELKMARAYSASLEEAGPRMTFSSDSDSSLNHLLSPSSEAVQAHEDERELPPGRRLSTEDILDLYRSKYESLRKTHMELMRSAHSQLNVIEEKLRQSTERTEEAIAERQRLQELIRDLMEQVEESEKRTREQFEALQAQLSAQQKQSRAEVLQKRFNTAETMHKIEMEAAKAKHRQQIVDISGQLDAYQQQVEKQNEELMEWRTKHQELERVAVTPMEAVDLWRRLEELAETDPSAEEKEEVQQQVMQVMQRLVQLHAMQEKDKRQWERTVLAARKREKKSEEELSLLRLQLEYLLEDTKVSPEEWQQQLAQQREDYQQQISDILEREEQRMAEMEYLEVRLTELAFLSVEVEDLEAEFKENEANYAKVLKTTKLKDTNETPIESLRAQIEAAALRQKEQLSHLAKASSGIPSTGGEVAKLQSKLSDSSHQYLRAELHHKEEALRRAQEQARLSQLRVAELEAQVGKLRSDTSTVGSTAQLSEMS